MNSYFAKELNEFLETELDEYGFEWAWECEGDTAIVTVKNDTDKEAELYFSWNDESKDLEIDFYDSGKYMVSSHNHTVKHFWMVLAPKMFD